jgi:hypothetical protein
MLVLGVYDPRREACGNTTVASWLNHPINWSIVHGSKSQIKVYD